MKTLIHLVFAGVVLTMGQAAMADSDEYRYRGDSEGYSERYDNSDRDEYRERGEYRNNDREYREQADSDGNVSLSQRDQDDRKYEKF